MSDKSLNQSRQVNESVNVNNDREWNEYQKHAAQLQQKVWKVTLDSVVCV